MEFTKLTYDLAFTTWYYTLKNENLLDYEIFSYWNEFGGLEKLASKLPLSTDMKIGELLSFDFFSDELFDTERNLTEDFGTGLFQIIEIKHCFWELEEEEITLCKRYELAPIQREV